MLNVTRQKTDKFATIFWLVNFTETGKVQRLTRDLGKMGEVLGIIYVCTISRKTKIFYPLIHTRTCPYQEVRNISFRRIIAYVLNEWPLNEVRKCHF